MPRNSGVFATLPENFFSPLASPNREHYAALLVLYFRLFQENSRGLEREQVMRSFTDYLGRNRDALLADEPGELEEDFSEEADPRQGELDFDSGRSQAEGPPASGLPDRTVASRFLRKLIASGWLDEETLPDYSRVINITPQGRPFFEALARVEEGLKTEYESHVVAIYSLLCGDAAAENGHYAVLNAHNATTALIDSLKVLSQSIKGHYDRFTADAASVGISGLLHLHYDIYANDILDGAYKRLKTSDNLSRYRPKIIKKVGDLLADEAWLADSARKLSRLGSGTMSDGRRRLETMLEEIRDTLRAVDPLLEDIDRRNMLYARASIERVKTLLEPDSTIAGKLTSLVRELYAYRGHDRLCHRVHALRLFAPESLYRRYRRDAVEPKRAFFAEDKEAARRAEEDLLLRLERQLGPAKISGWLDGQGGRQRLLAAADLVRDENSFVRFVYSVLYADSRPRFTYHLEENPESPVESAGYLVPDITLRRKQ
ncbi:MAG: DUF5716 family protein [Spirochaetia bacterium]|jgi:hypothetical protein|nr:DUF5716 family protein [Spirochaetia bacterium]